LSDLLRPLADSIHSLVADRESFSPIALPPRLACVRARLACFECRAQTSRYRGGRFAIPLGEPVRRFTLFRDRILPEDCQLQEPAPLVLGQLQTTDPVHVCLTPATSPGLLEVWRCNRPVPLNEPLQRGDLLLYDTEILFELIEWAPS
jgi:hypothetical protein